MSSLKKHLPGIAVAFLFIFYLYYQVQVQQYYGLFQKGDTFFHVSRVYEIRYAFLYHELPNWLNYHSYFGLGQAVNGMYPDLMLWPLVLVTLPLPLMKQIIAIRVVILALTCLVTYLSLVKRKYQSNLAIFAAVIYTLSGYSLYQATTEIQLGTGIIYIFSFPLFFALVDLFKRKKIDRYLVLRLGLLFTIIVSSHLLSAVILAFIVALILLYHWLIDRDFNWAVLANLALSGITSAVLSMPVLYRYFYLSRSGLAKPYGQGMITADTVQKMVSDIDWSTRTTFSAISLVLLAICLFFGKKSEKMVKLLLLELMLALLCTNFFPWNLIDKIPMLNNFQYTPWRFGIWLSIIPIILYLTTFANPLKVSSKLPFKFLLLLALMTPLISGQAIKSLNENPVKRICITQSFMDSSQGNVETVNDEFHNYLLIRDYAPIESSVKDGSNRVTKLTSNLAFHPFIANSKKQQAKVWREPVNNGVKIHVQADLKGRSFRLPLYKYRTVRYSVKVNGQEVEAQKDKQGYMQVATKQSLHKGDVITVNSYNPATYPVIVVISLLLFVGCCAVLWCHEGKLKNRLDLKI